MFKLPFTNQLVGKIELPSNSPTWRIQMENQNQIELNGRVFRKAVVTAKWSKWYQSEVLVLFYKEHEFGSLVTVLCDDAKIVILNAGDVSYL